LEDLARRQGGPNGQPYLNPQQSEELKFNQRELERLKSKKEIKDTEYEKLLGNVSNTTDNFSKYVDDYKNSLPGGKYGGESTSSNTNAPLRISSDFGMRAHPFTGIMTPHEGVDINVKEGTDIVAVEKGKVTSARNSSSYGNVIEIDHGNGRTTKYAHLKSMQVAVGDMVAKGQKIGLSGNTGQSKGAHLHFEELQNGVAKKPSQELAFSAIRGQMLNDGSRALADASRPDTSPPNINVSNQQAAAPAQPPKPQNAQASAHNFDPWVEIWSASILNPARMGM
jgi:murein DD-endopeptidase MepM/ murein hydrolase activator NlpD